MELGGGPVTAEELFEKVRSKGNWSDDTIWQHLMQLVINLPPAYRHWPHAPERFLFLREDGKYELYDTEKHGTYIEGTRIEATPAPEKAEPMTKYTVLEQKLREYLTRFFSLKHTTITNVPSNYRGTPGVYAFFENNHAIYVGSTTDLHRRLTHDLWRNLGQPEQPHTFGRKLLDKFGTKGEARKYLEHLQLKILETENITIARVLEQILIYLLSPEYNSK